MVSSGLHVGLLCYAVNVWACNM